MYLRAPPPVRTGATPFVYAFLPMSSHPAPDAAGSHSAIAPTQRIDAMDVLRGFALIGILAMNIEWFNRPIALLGGFDPDLRGVDYAASWFVKVFVEGKLYKLFALLFGMGFAVMLLRAEAAGRPFGLIMSRRLGALLLFGLLHLFLLWNGDILHDYALGGFALLGWLWLLRRQRLQRFNNPTSILRFGVFMLSLPFVVMTAAGIYFALTHDHGKLATAYQEGQQVYQQSRAMLEDLRSKPDAEQRAIITAHEQAIKEEQAANKKSKEPDLDALPPAERIAAEVKERNNGAFVVERRVLDERTAFTSGSYWQATALRYRHGLRHLAGTLPFVASMLLYIFLLGYWLIVTGRMRDSVRHAQFFRLLMLVGVGFGLPLNIAAVMIGVHPAARGVEVLQNLAGGMFLLGQYVLAAGYLGTFVTLVNSPRWRRLVLWLAPLGRMALSNYLMHSLILSTLFYGYGFGKFGHIPRGPQMLIVAAIIACQWLWSRWWLRHYYYGPMEWVWRCLTYWSRQPLRIAGAP
jgi:uncharacterized membrane protein YeiB